MPWPSGPVQIGAIGENAALHFWVDGAQGRIATPPTLEWGNLREVLIGRTIKGTATQSREFISPAAAAAGVYTDGGTSTAIAAGTLTDANQTWPVNLWTNYGVVSLGAGVTGLQFNVVASNTATVLTLKSNWGTTPGAASLYRIIALADQNQGASVTYAAGPANALVDTAKAWTVNQFRGFWVLAVTVAGISGRQIVSNTATQLTLDAAWGATPAANVAYGIVLPLPVGWNELQRGYGSVQPLSNPGANNNNPLTI